MLLYTSGGSYKSVYSVNNPRGVNEDPITLSYTLTKDYEELLVVVTSGGGNGIYGPLVNPVSGITAATRIVYHAPQHQRGSAWAQAIVQVHLLHNAVSGTVLSVQVQGPSVFQILERE